MLAGASGRAWRSLSPTWRCNEDHPQSHQSCTNSARIECINHVTEITERRRSCWSTVEDLLVSLLLFAVQFFQLFQNLSSTPSVLKAKKCPQSLKKHSNTLLAAAYGPWDSQGFRHSPIQAPSSSSASFSFVSVCMLFEFHQFHQRYISDCCQTMDSKSSTPSKEEQTPTESLEATQNGGFAESRQSYSATNRENSSYHLKESAKTRPRSNTPQMLRRMRLSQSREKPQNHVQSPQFKTMI